MQKRCQHVSTDSILTICAICVSCLVSVTGPSCFFAFFQNGRSAGTSTWSHQSSESGRAHIYIYIFIHTGKGSSNGNGTKLPSVSLKYTLLPLIDALCKLFSGQIWTNLAFGFERRPLCPGSQYWSPAPLSQIHPALDALHHSPQTPDHQLQR